MKFIQTGAFRENYLNEQTSIIVKKSIGKILFDKFDYFFGFIKNKKSEKIKNFVKNLSMKYKKLAKEGNLEIAFKGLKKEVTKYKNLLEYPELVKTALNYLINLLQIKKIEGWENTEMEITRKALIQAWTFPSYFLLETLAETVGRKEAVKLFKRYITNYYIEHPSPAREKFVSLEKRFENRTTGDTTSSEWVIVHTMLEEGKYAIKNKNCPTCADASAELPDKEFKYLAFCYGDYAAFRANMSDHIILTMEHTIIQGNPYCSRVMHDTRIDWDLRHPPKEFWDNFEPGNEKKAMNYYKKAK